MKDLSDNLELRKEVLAASEELSNPLLTSLIGEVRKKKRAQYLRKTALVTVSLLILLSWRLQFNLTKNGCAKRETVQSRINVPRHSGETPEILIKTEAFAQKDILSTLPGNIDIVTTGSEQGFKPIDDQELFSMFPGKSMALIRQNPKDVQLVFIE